MASPTASLVATTLSAVGASGATPSGMMPTGTMSSGMMPSGAMSGAMPSGSGMAAGGSNSSSGGGSGGGGMMMMGPHLTPEQLMQWRGQEVYWAVGVGMVACAAFFACRLASRYMTRVALRPSDWLLLAGIVCTYGLAGCYIWSVKAGTGTHFQALVMEDPTMASAGEPFKVRAPAH